MQFALYVALRYLRAKRKERFFSVVTVISVAGVAAGVAALIIAMAINNGVQAGLRDNLIGAYSHINLVERNPNFGIEDYPALMEDLAQVEHVEAVAPTLYGEMMIATPVRAKGCVIKGVDPDAELRVSQILTTLVEGSFEDLQRSDGEYPGILLGARLAEAIGARVSTIVKVISPQGEMTPLGPLPLFKHFQVVGIFDTGFFELDNLWTVCLLRDAQRSLAIGDVINSIEFRLDDLDASIETAMAIEERAGADYKTSTWLERNRVLFNALETEKLVTALIIGMIMLVAALNILISLVMMVMEKTKDIAILKSLGTRNEQIRKIFVWQGIIIGTLGTVVGLALGHLTCWLCDRYQLIRLDAEIYGLSYVPFAPRPLDGVLVAIAAVFISYVITVYPSSTATRVAPAEVLRYE